MTLEQHQAFLDVPLAKPWVIVSCLLARSLGTYFFKLSDLFVPQVGAVPV